MNPRVLISPKIWTLAVLVSCVWTMQACSRSPGSGAQQHVAAAQAHFEQKRFNDAIIEYQNALKADPELAVARLNLARAYAATNQYRNVVQ